MAPITTLDAVSQRPSAPLRRLLVAAAVAAAFAGGFAFRGLLAPPAVVHAQTADRVFELRTYTAAPGKLEDLKARFRAHTVRMFEKHGMTNIGYWVPLDEPLSTNTLTYVLAYPSREAARASWAAFRADEEWVAARTASEAGGPLTTRVESMFMAPADFSPMK